MRHNSTCVCQLNGIQTCSESIKPIRHTKCMNEIHIKSSYIQEKNSQNRFHRLFANGTAALRVKTQLASRPIDVKYYLDKRL